MNSTTPRRRGRPPLGDQPMRHIHVRLDEETIAAARVLGEGNLSEGLRRAVRSWPKPDPAEPEIVESINVLTISTQ